MIRTITTPVAVVGGGPAGMAAALAASEEGARVLVIERNPWLGGILPQCVHDGFGLSKFQAMLTGPEYAELYADRVNNDSSITVMLGAMVTDATHGNKLVCITREGLLQVRADALVFATGCRERTRGALGIPGTRPAGIFTAGVAQQLMNLYNVAIGKRAVILGSGDVGLIMARRLTLSGMEVACVLEKFPVSGGLPRNVSQCLEDFNIPLRLSQTVTNIHGNKRLVGVTVASLDSGGNEIPGSEYYIPCDTLLLSVGLIPENEIIKKIGVRMRPDTKGPQVTEYMETTVSGVFSCGNSLHVNDLADNVSDEGEAAGKWAARHALSK